VSGTVIPSSVTSTPKRAQTKRGLGVYGTKSCSDIRLLGNVTWVYNWSEDPDQLEQCYEELGIQFIPMIWGLNSHPEYIYGKSPYLLTFNEPNFADQANMTPKQAADFWPKIEAAAAKYGMKISSPSASYGGFMDPIDWLDEFFRLCTNCKVDFITTHQYNCAPYDLYGAITNFKKYNKPIWVTEFACWDSSSQANTASFMQTLLPLFENDTSIERYAWFGSRTTTSNINVFDYTKNALTPGGVFYASTPSNSAPSSTTASTSNNQNPSSAASVITASIGLAMLSFVLFC